MPVVIVLHEENEDIAWVEQWLQAHEANPKLTRKFLAGWFEGEGTIRQNNGGLELRGYTTDLDTALKVWLALGVGSLRFARKKNEKKVCYEVSIHGKKAREKVLEILPYFSVRRKRQVAEALNIDTGGTKDEHEYSN